MLAPMLKTTERKKNIRCDLKTEPWSLTEYDNYSDYKNSGKEFDGSKDVFKVSNRHFEHPLK